MKQQAEGLHSSQCPVVELNHHTADNSLIEALIEESDRINCQQNPCRVLCRGG